jgi:uncharacterized protein YjcR
MGAQGVPENHACKHSIWKVERKLKWKMTVYIRQRRIMKVTANDFYFLIESSRYIIT